MTHECPEPQLLGALFDGVLPAAEEEALHAQMLGCPDCQALLAAVGLAVEDEMLAAPPPVPEALLHRVKRMGARESPLALAVRWVQGLLEPLASALAPQPLAAGLVRGGDSACDRLSYQVTLGDLPFEILVIGEDDAHVTLVAHPVHAPPAGLSLKLSCEGQMRAFASLTVDGTTIRGLEPARYELSVERAGEAVGSLTVAVEGRAVT